MNGPEPLLHPVPLKQLRPTQITLGLREVEEKRRQWRGHVVDNPSEFLGRHMIPVVVGLKERRYVVDHHHLCRALLEEGVDSVLVSVVADLSGLSKSAFWVFLDNRNWCHPYDAEGRRLQFEDIPKSIMDMLDDPYRSLAGELRRAGGYAKNPTPFSEFLWADFLRRRIKVSLVRHDFGGALTEALSLARHREASYLPGWCGPDPID